MYRFVFRTLYRTRSHAVNAYRECVPSRKCDLSLLPFIRVSNGGRPQSLSTSSISYCESKGGAALPPRDDEKRGAKKDGDLAETATEGKVDDDGHKTVETTSELPPETRGAERDGDAAQLTATPADGTTSDDPPLETKDGYPAALTATSADGKADGFGTTSELPLDTRGAEKDGDPAAETATEGKVDGERELVATTPGREETSAGLKTEVESSARQQVDDTTGGVAVPAGEQTAAEPETTEAEEKPAVLTEVDEEVQRVVEVKKKRVAKSGKESLLDLLGTMKVDVTTTKKKKLLRPPYTPPEAPPVKPLSAAMESTITMFKKATAEAPAQSETLGAELLAAASAAASTLPDRRQAESELLRQLRRHEAVAPEEQRRGEPNDLKGIIADMKVGRSITGRQNIRGSNQIRFDDDGQGYTQDRGITAELDSVRRRRGLFSGKRLNIFPAAEDKVEAAIAGPTLWDIDFTNQLVLSINNMPRNGLEEMIQWTKDGRLWQYPVDNEAGLDEERLVPFHEHVFLEKHLEEGFPSRGPVRHFMELVVAGLATNSQLTVGQKKDHIAWFRDYFREKEDVLKEAEVFLN